MPRAGIVPGGNIRRTDLVGVIGQRTKFNKRIAHHARIRRARIAERVGKIPTDLLLKRFAPMCNIQRDSQIVRRVLRGFLAAESHLKEQAVHLIAHIPQPRCGNSGVHAARKSQYYLFCHEKSPVFAQFPLVQVSSPANALYGEGA